MGYCSPHRPLPRNLYFQGFVRPTQRDAVIWISGQHPDIAGRDARDNAESAAEAEKRLKENGHVMVQVPSAAKWAQRTAEHIKSTSRAFPLEYCNGVVLSVRWIAPVFGPDGSVEFLMSNHFDGSIYVTDYSGSKLIGNRRSGPPRRVMRVQNPELPEEMTFIVLQSSECDYAIPFSRDKTPRTERYSALEDPWNIGRSVLDLQFRRGDEVVLSNDFAITTKLWSNTMHIYHYWFCHKSGVMKIEKVKLVGSDLGRYIEAIPVKDGWCRLDASVVGSTLYTWWRKQCNHLMSWDISPQSLQQSKFGQALGVHFFWNLPKTLHHLAHASIYGFHGGMMFLGDNTARSSATEFHVFGPSPPPAPADPSAIRKTVDAEEQEEETFLCGEQPAAKRPRLA